MNKTITLNKNEIDLLLNSYLTTIYNDFTESESKARKSIIKKLMREPIKISSRKAKGRSLQYWVCNKIAEKFHIKYIQSDDSCLIHSREMGQHGCDIIIRGELLRQFPYSIECKNTESLNILNTINQAKSNQKEKTSWMIIHKKKGYDKPIIILEFEEFLRIYKNEKK